MSAGANRGGKASPAGLIPFLLLGGYLAAILVRAFSPRRPVPDEVAEPESHADPGPAVEPPPAEHLVGSKPETDLDAPAANAIEAVVEAGGDALPEVAVEAPGEMVADVAAEGITEATPAQADPAAEPSDEQESAAEPAEQLMPTPLPIHMRIRLLIAHATNLVVRRVKRPPAPPAGTDRDSNARQLVERLVRRSPLRLASRFVVPHWKHHARSAVAVAGVAAVVGTCIAAAAAGSIVAQRRSTAWTPAHRVVADIEADYSSDVATARLPRLREEVISKAISDQEAQVTPTPVQGSDPVASPSPTPVRGTPVPRPTRVIPPTRAANPSVVVQTPTPRTPIAPRATPSGGAEVTPIVVTPTPRPAVVSPTPTAATPPSQPPGPSGTTGTGGSGGSGGGATGAPGGSGPESGGSAPTAAAGSPTPGGTPTPRVIVAAGGSTSGGTGGTSGPSGPSGISPASPAGTPAGASAKPPAAAATRAVVAPRTAPTRIEKTASSGLAFIVAGLVMLAVLAALLTVVWVGATAIAVLRSRRAPLLTPMLQNRLMGLGGIRAARVPGQRDRGDLRYEDGGEEPDGVDDGEGTERVDEVLAAQPHPADEDREMSVYDVAAVDDEELGRTGSHQQPESASPLSAASADPGDLADANAAADAA